MAPSDGVVGLMVLYMLLVHFLQPTLQAAPVMSVFKNKVVVTLLDSSKEQVELTRISCTDADAGDVVRISLISLTPSFPCGNCFILQPCGVFKGQPMCLYYNPGEGKLSFTSSPFYTADVQCSDGTDTVFTSIEIRLEQNEMPRVDRPTNSYGSVDLTRIRFMRSGDIVFNRVDVSDKEGDPVSYTMTTFPRTDLIEIVYGNGVIRAVGDLRYICEDSMRLLIDTRDTHGNQVPPITMDLNFANWKNRRPVVDNTQTVVEMRENPEHKNANIGTDVLRVDVTDKTVFYRDILFKLRAEPERGLEYYTLLVFKDKAKIQTRKRLDYEYAPLREVKLYVDVSDGFCDASTYSVTVRITNVNEPPKILPEEDLERWVYEGFINFDPGWVAVDPDEGDKLEWVMPGGGGEFDVDPATGFIFSRGDFNVDPNTEQKVRTLEVKIVDLRKEQNKAKMKLFIMDKNDNAPAFFNRLYSFSATECSRVGSLIGKVNARDDDSSFQGNDQLVFSGSGSNISVLSTGDVILSAPCKAGQTESMAVKVTDQGTFPGPLSGLPATITFTCRVCPTVPPGSVTESVNARRLRLRIRFLRGLKSRGILDGQAGAAKSDFVTSNLAWIVPSAIIGPLVFFISMLFIWRFCWGPCKRFRINLKLRQKSLSRTPKPQKPKKPLPPEPVRPKLPQLPRIDDRLCPPDPPPPETDPRFFGFWKETYVDRDQRHMPERDVLPATVTEDKVVEEKEKLEWAEEHAKRLEARQKVMDDFQKEVDEYHQKVQARNSLRQAVLNDHQSVLSSGSTSSYPIPKTPSSPPKSKSCIIL